MLIEKKMFTKINFINFFICFIPLSLVIGNLAININLVLICLFGAIIYKFELFKLSKRIYQYLIFGFFFYLILITLFQGISSLNDANLDEWSKQIVKENLFKSFFFLRYLILFLVVAKLIEKNSFNLNLFLISCAFFSFILAIDILVQVNFGKNLVGMPIESKPESGWAKPSSFFGSEIIAGGYIQKFSLFFFSLGAYFFKNEKIKLNIYGGVFFIFFLFSIILTSNRMPVILYLFSFFLFFFAEKKFKEIFIILGISFVILTSLMKFPDRTFSSLPRLHSDLKNFYHHTVDILLKTPKLFYSNSVDKPMSNSAASHVDGRITSIGSANYLITFNSGVQVWKKNKFLGGGLKSFRINCEYGKNTTCNSHPHNYMIEILVDTGVVGLILIYSIFILAALDFMKLYNKSLDLKFKFLFAPFFLITFLEFFPVRSTGSFFTTNNATIIFFMLAVLVGLPHSKFSKKITTTK